MHDDFYQMYLNEIEMVPACDADELKQLVTRNKGDQAAEKRLIEGKLGQVLAVAKEFAGRGILMGDLVQEANIALTLFVKAYQGTAAAFDESLDTAVRSQLKRAIDEQEQSKEIEENVLARVNVLQQISKQMAEDLGREASVEELARMMKMTEDEIKDIMKVTLDALSVSPGEEN